MFVSYAHEDEPWGASAGRQPAPGGPRRVLRSVGGGRGKPPVAAVAAGLESSRVVVLVVSRVAVIKEWWQEEFAAAMAGVVAGVQRLVPVLLDDVPPTNCCANSNRG